MLVGSIVVSASAPSTEPKPVRKQSGAAIGLRDAHCRLVRCFRGGRRSASTSTVAEGPTVARRHGLHSAVAGEARRSPT